MRNKISPFLLFYHGEILFTQNYLQTQIYSRNNNYCKKAGLRHIRIHNFRYSCASALISAAAPITVVSNYLGHSETTETLETYTHLVKKDYASVPKFFDSLEKDFKEKSSD